MSVCRDRVCRSLLSLLVLLGLGVLSNSATAQIDDSQVQPQIISSTQSVQPGKPFTVGVHFEIQDTWHLYWINPEGDGFAPEVAWSLPDGYTVSKPRWPAPHTFAFQDSIQFGYENQLTLLFDITPPADAVGSAELKAGLSWLACDSANCVPNKEYPGTKPFSLTLPVTADQPELSADAAKITDAEESIPRALPGWSFTTEVVDDGFVLVIQTPSEADAKALDGLYFFSSKQFAVDPEAKQVATVDGKTVRLSLKARKTDAYDNPIKHDKPITKLQGVLTAKRGFGDAGIKALRVGDAVQQTDTAADQGAEADKPADQGATQPIGFALAVGFAFIGGLILNLMPCVFPVLSIKILGFVQLAGEKPAIVRRHGYAFGAGVMVSFWALVAVLLILRGLAQAAAESSGASGGSVSWGFQLQNPAFVLGMLLLMFLIGLNLIGAFEVGVGLSAVAGKASQSTKDGYGKSFFTGVLATLIATPCTGPFMAPALGAAIAMPTAQAIIVFTALGAGMAMPYVVLSCFPNLLDYLPRPGAWMESFKQAMAFPMFATAGWLAWVYITLTSDEMLARLLIGLSVVALGMWIYGRWTQPIRTSRTKWIARAIALITVVGGIGMVQAKALAMEQARIEAERARAAGEYVLEWVEYSPEKVAMLRQGDRPILIDFTASWCAICQFNKKTSLRTDAAAQLYEEYDVVLVEADYSRKDPIIGKVLEQYNRAGVPLYLVFPAGDPNAQPEVLPNTLTPTILENAIKRAAGNRADTDSDTTSAEKIERKPASPEQASKASEYKYEWIDYSPKTVTTLRTTGQPILIDVSARWCAICQVNKRSLQMPEMQRFYEQHNDALVEGDYTHKNPVIAKLLEKYDRPGVPLNLVFPAGNPDAEPEVLPPKLTPKLVQDAIKRAAGESPASGKATARR